MGIAARAVHVFTWQAENRRDEAVAGSLTSGGVVRRLNVEAGLSSRVAADDSAASFANAEGKTNLMRGG